MKSYKKYAPLHRHQYCIKTVGLIKHSSLVTMLFPSMHEVKRESAAIAVANTE